jgi:hypothetical protein
MSGTYVVRNSTPCIFTGNGGVIVCPGTIGATLQMGIGGGETGPYTINIGVIIALGGFNESATYHITFGENKPDCRAWNGLVVPLFAFYPGTPRLCDVWPSQVTVTAI